jgi:uncharacterized protein YndB with AHSA1/START domain
MGQESPGMKKSQDDRVTKRDTLIFTRIFDAPRERVWKTWTEPERVKRWWGPEFFTAPFIEIDLRVGGKYLFCMRSPDGSDFWSAGVYREIVPMNRIVYSQNFADELGNTIPASQIGLPGNWPAEIAVTVTFKEQGDRIKVTVQEVGIPEEMREMAELGMNQSLDKFAKVLEE